MNKTSTTVPKYRKKSGIINLMCDDVWRVSTEVHGREAWIIFRASLVMLFIFVFILLEYSLEYTMFWGLLTLPLFVSLVGEFFLTWYRSAKDRLDEKEDS